MSNFDDFFGGVVGGGVGLFPIFPPKRATKNSLQTKLDGFLANGDCIVPPIVVGAAATMKYHNSAGGLVWSKVPTDINAACDTWAGFTLDSVNNLLWVTAFVDATDTVYLATINAAGTISVKGSFVQVGIGIAADGWYGTSIGGAKRGPVMWRDVEGVGNFYLAITSVLIEINYLTGAKVSTANASPHVGSFKTTSGTYVSIGPVNAASVSNGLPSAIVVDMYNPGSGAPNGARASRVFAPLEIGLPVIPPSPGVAVSNERFAIMHWRGEIVLVLPSSADTNIGPGIYDYQDFLDAADQLISNFNMDV